MVYKQRTWSILLWFQLTPASSRALCSCPFRSLKTPGTDTSPRSAAFLCLPGPVPPWARCHHTPLSVGRGLIPPAGRNRSVRLSAALRLPGSRPFVIRSPAQNRQTVRMDLTPDSLGNGIPSPRAPAAHPSRTFLPQQAAALFFSLWEIRLRYFGANVM